MLQQRTAQQLVDGNVSGYCAGQTWLYAVLTATRHAYAIWGCPDAADIQALLAFFDASYGKLQPHVILVDLRALETANLAPFEAFRRYFSQRAASLTAMVVEACIVLPDSLAGSVAAGFFGIATAPFPFTTTKAVEAGASQLGFEPCDLAVYHTCVVDVVGGDFEQRFGRALAQDLVNARIDRVAQRLGMSARTLQRTLQGRATSFSNELAVARIAQAKTLLQQRPMSIAQVAYEVGFKSPEHFATAFRLVTGTTPSAYRKTFVA
jgi:AraC-like DNA-binding protein